MDQFMGSPPFDEVISAGDLQLESVKDSPDSRSAKARLGGRRTSQRCEPNSAFIMVYLMSSHFSYSFPQNSTSSSTLGLHSSS